MKRKNNNHAFAALFLLSFALLVFPQSMQADGDPFYFLKYGGMLFLRYLPLVGLAALIKLYLLKRKYSLTLKMVGRISIKTIAEIYAEITYFLLLFYFLSPHIVDKILNKIGFISSIEKNPEAVKLLFTIIILLPLQLILAVILNLVLIYTYWSDQMKKTSGEFLYGLLLAAIFPVILILFAAAGMLAKQATPLL